MGLGDTMNSNQTGAWSEDRVSQLKKLWAAGSSARQIAVTIGGGLTRNAVLSKVHRLGISARSTGHPPHQTFAGYPRAPKPPQSKRTRAENREAERSPGALPVEPINDDPNIFDGLIPQAQRRTLLGLEKRECRWPVGLPGTPEFFFCGAPSKEDKPYCEPHCERAFSRPTWHQPRQLNRNPGGKRL